MNGRNSLALDLNIARARLILAPATLLSIYIDTAKPDLTPWFRLTGGLLQIDRYALIALLFHLGYAAAIHVYASLRPLDRWFVAVAAVMDVAFAIIVAVFTEGPTSPSYAFFTFAIFAVGCREGFRATVAVTASSALAYMSLIVVSGSAASDYLMRPVYLAITGYLIGYLGQQRINFEARVRELESLEERHSIARSLHDGYVQALAAVNLRLGGCRQLLHEGAVDAALGQLKRAPDRRRPRIRRGSVVHPLADRARGGIGGNPRKRNDDISRSNRFPHERLSCRADLTDPARRSP